MFVTLPFIGLIFGFKHPLYRWATTLLALMIFLPPLLISLGTTVLQSHFWAFTRFVLYIMPPYLILAALGLTRLARWFLSRPGSRNLSVAYPAFVIILLVPVTFPIFLRVQALAENHFPNLLNVARYIQTHAQPGELIICVPDKDWRITTGREECSLSLNFYRHLGPYVYNLDQLADYETLKKVMDQKTICTNQYVHLPHPTFQIECKASSEVNLQPAIWLIMWRNRAVTAEAARSEIRHSLVKQRIGATDMFYLDAQSSRPDTLLQAGQLALAESKTPLRKFENYISLATLYLAAGKFEDTLRTLDEAAFVSQWPEAIERLNTLQAQLSFLPLPIKPKVKMNPAWDQKLALAGIDQNLAEVKLLPGGILQITFYWQALQSLTTNYQIFLHLIDRTGTPTAIFDYQPFDGQRPVTAWPPHQVIRETRTFKLPDPLPSGPYSLIVGVYQPETLERLPLSTSSGNEWLLATWEIK